MSQQMTLLNAVTGLRPAIRDNDQAVVRATINMISADLSARIRRRASRARLPDADRDDLLQRGLMKLVRVAPEHFDGGEPGAKQYLEQIAKNLVVDMVRRPGYRGEMPLPEDWANLLSDGAPPAQAAERLQQQADLAAFDVAMEAALSAVPERTQTATRQAYEEMLAVHLGQTETDTLVAQRVAAAYADQPPDQAQRRARAALHTAHTRARERIRKAGDTLQASDQLSAETHARLVTVLGLLRGKQQPARAPKKRPGASETTARSESDGMPRPPHMEKK